MDDRSLSHTRWKCQYHIVFISKYRKRILYGRLREDVKEIISTLCKYRKVDIIAGAVCKDHVHLSVAIPPKLRVSDFMGYLKGKSTLMIYDRHPELQSKWDKAFWAGQPHKKYPSWNKNSLMDIFKWFLQFSEKSIPAHTLNDRYTAYSFFYKSFSSFYQIVYPISLGYNKSF